MAVRLIDANALQELCNMKIQDTWNNGTAPVSWAHAYADFKDDIDSIPTLTPPNEWVSVENALPPEHESVLCIVSGKPKSNITLEDAYQLGSWNKADGWIIDEWLDWEGANVTWWMKLPAPPARRPPEGEEDT